MNCRFKFQQRSVESRHSSTSSELGPSDCEGREGEPPEPSDRQTVMGGTRWVAALGVLLAACSATTDDAFDVIGERQTNADYDLGPSTIIDFLDGAGDTQPLVVEGTITRVDDGVGMTWALDERGENEQRTILSFGNDDAMVRSAHLTLDVERVIASPPQTTVADGAVRFGLTVDDTADVDVLRDGLIDQHVVVFLRRTAVFDYEDDLYGVVVDGSLLCRRGGSQPLECPALEFGLADALKLDSVTEAMLTGP